MKPLVRISFLLAALGSLAASMTHVWVLYALSAVDYLPRLPLIRTGLIAIATVLLMRGLIVLPIAILMPAQLTSFVILSSLICLGLGALYGVGIIFGWTELGPQT